MKIRPYGVELFYATRRTDMTKLTVLFFRNFEDAPKKNWEWGHTKWLHVMKTALDDTKTAVICFDS